jgi:hypothetical protein
VKPRDNSQPTTSRRPPRPGARSTRVRRLGLVIGLLISLQAAGLDGGSLARAQDAQPTEYEVKAAFLYNFTRFIEWPTDAFEGPQTPMVIGILGEDPFGPALDDIIAGKKVGGRDVVVRRLHRDQDRRGCHLLFISASEKKHLPEILLGLRGSTVVTVSEIDRFIYSGGTINLLVENSRVRFEVNLDAAARARAKISAKLLALARGVVDDRAGKRN